MQLLFIKMVMIHRFLLILSFVVFGCVLCGCRHGEIIKLMYPVTDRTAIREALIAGANPNITDKKGRSPLYLAALRNDVELVNILLENGANPMHRVWSKSGETALHVAADKGYDGIVHILLSEGIDVNIQSWAGIAPIHNAAWMKRATTVDVLLINGADPMLRTKNGQTALNGIGIYGDKERYLEVVKLLVQAGVPVDVTEDQLGRTPLFEACLAGNESVVGFLIEEGADPNYKDNSGRTPLMITTSRGELKIARLLLAAGADKYIEDDEGGTAFSRARDRDDEAMFKILNNR